VTSPLSALLQIELGLTPCEAAIIERLERCAGWLPTATLNVATAPFRSFDDGWRIREADTVKVHVWAIRRKTGRDDFILGHWQRGFTLGASGVTTVRRLRKTLDGLAVAS
jgi:hypothetical protein